MIATKSPIRKQRPTKVPDYLVYEIMDGKPIYYKGYREVLSGTKQVAEIMGNSKLQSFILDYLLTTLILHFGGKRKYHFFTGENGLHLSNKNNLAGDLHIFEKAKIPAIAIDGHYADVPPKVAIEIDISADVADMGDDGYIYTKTQKLLDFGTERVIWVTTKAQKILIATPDAAWQVVNWNQTVLLLEDCSFNLHQHFDNEGIDPKSLISKG